MINISVPVRSDYSLLLEVGTRISGTITHSGRSVSIVPAERNYSMTIEPVQSGVSESVVAFETAAQTANEVTAQSGSFGLFPTVA